MTGQILAQYEEGTTMTTATQNGTVTDAQKVAWLTNFMFNQIGDTEWGTSGMPSEWDEADWERWAAAGNTAVLRRRADIEAGSTTAGAVWCNAATEAATFYWTQDTERFIHDWFVANRTAIDNGLASLVPEGGQTLADPHADRLLMEGDMVAYQGLLWRVARPMRAGETIVSVWRDEDGTTGNRQGVPRADVVWMEPGVARLRRTGARDRIYTEVCVAGREYIFMRSYSPQDRAIYVRNVGGTRDLGYMGQSSFVPIVPALAAPRAWDAGRVLRTKQTVFTPNGEVGLCLAEDNVVHTDHRVGTIKVYKRNTGAWRDSHVPMTEVNFAVAGDPIVGSGDVTGLFVRNHNDEMLVVTVNGVEAQWRRQDCKYTGQPATPKPPIENLVVVVDGVEYVRKDVIDKDIATQTAVLHKGSVEHSLCGVYDRVTAESDRRTEYIKMGPRYRDYDIEVEQTVVIRRTIRVTQQVDEDTARTTARNLASDYVPRNIPGRRTGEPEMRVMTVTNTDRVGTATVVATP